MSFLDNNGLSYFYNKLKSKFIRSVNSQTADENGNVDITHVLTADNLTSQDGQTIVGTFINRASGGAASIQNGIAKLLYVDGGIDIQGRVEENFAFSSTNELEFTYNSTIWQSLISQSGSYQFTYTMPTSSTAAASWTPSDGQWQYNGSNISIDSYGLFPINLTMPSLAISSTSSLTNLKIVPNSWLSVSLGTGTYNFIYNGSNWLYDGSSVVIGNYGISYNGTPTNGDIIVVEYTAGTKSGTITVNYTAPNQGTIIVARPNSFQSTEINQFDYTTMTLDGYIDVSGTAPKIHIRSQAEPLNTSILCYCKAVTGTNGYTVFYDNDDFEIIRAGWSNSIANNASIVLHELDEEVETSNHFHVAVPENGYIVVELSKRASVTLEQLTIHPTQSGAEDNSLTEYFVNTIIFPTVDINNVTLPIGLYGMPKIGSAADRIDFEGAKYIKKIGRLQNTPANMSLVQELNTEYDYDNNYIYYVLDTPVTYTLAQINNEYTVNDYGTEQFISNYTSVALTATNYYGYNLKDKLRKDVLTISRQDLTLEQKRQVYYNLGLNSLVSYQAGEIEFNNEPMVLNGFITGGGKVIVLDYITGKNIPYQITDNIMSSPLISINTITGPIRSYSAGAQSSSGYINNSTSVDYDWASVANIETYFVNSHHLTIKIRSNTPFLNAINNEPVSAYLKLRIQFGASIVPN